ncbi:hypothetical protein ETR_00300 [Erwinia tracheiphila PSU-1]|nr:hypothetical protein ETR_00300 [Erwinia tracheiphila PSU-1]
MTKLKCQNILYQRKVMPPYGLFISLYCCRCILNIIIIIFFFLYISKIFFIAFIIMTHDRNHKHTTRKRANSTLTMNSFRKKKSYDVHRCIGASEPHKRGYGEINFVTFFVLRQLIIKDKNLLPRKALL